MCAGCGNHPCRQLDDIPAPPRRNPRKRPRGRHVGAQAHHRIVPVNKHYIDRHTHEECVDAPFRVDDKPVAVWQLGAPHQAPAPRKKRRCQLGSAGKRRSTSRILDSDRWYRHTPYNPLSEFMIRGTAGPRMTTNSAGKMRNTIGNSILIGAFCAASSARCRRRIRI